MGPPKVQLFSNVWNFYTFATVGTIPRKVEQLSRNGTVILDPTARAPLPPPHPRFWTLNEGKPSTYECGNFAHVSGLFW